jgi:hypothetical protein
MILIQKFDACQLATLVDKDLDCNRMMMMDS